MERIEVLRAFRAVLEARFIAFILDTPVDDSYPPTHPSTNRPIMSSQIPSILYDCRVKRLPTLSDPGLSKSVPTAAADTHSLHTHNPLVSLISLQAWKVQPSAQKPLRHDASVSNPSAETDRPRPVRKKDTRLQVKISRRYRGR